MATAPPTRSPGTPASTSGSRRRRTPVPATPGRLQPADRGVTGVEPDPAGPGPVLLRLRRLPVLHRGQQRQHHDLHLRCATVTEHADQVPALHHRRGPPVDADYPVL